MSIEAKFHTPDQPDNPQRRIFITRTLPSVLLAGTADPRLFFAGPNSPELRIPNPNFAFISPTNPVLSLPADPSLDRQDPQDFRKRLIEDIYAHINSQGEDEPRLFTLVDIKNRLHPLGPYGDRMLVYSQKYAPQIDIPADVLAAYIASKSFHESLWNGTSNQTSPDVIKRAVRAGYGILQLMTREDGLGPDAPTFQQVDTVDKQLDWTMRDILKAANRVRATGRAYTINDLQYYFLGQSFRTNDIYDRFQRKVFADTRAFLRNMALFDLTGTDIVNFYETWQSQNNDSVSLSLNNLEMTFGSLVTSTPRPVQVMSGKHPISWRPSRKVLELAYYLYLKCRGSYQGVMIDRQMLIGVSGEEIYWALAVDGAKVRNYADLGKAGFNPYQGEKVKISEFLSPSSTPVLM